MFKYIVILLILSLVACSSQPKKQCKELDWEKVGFSQAVEGNTYDESISYYYQTCSQDHKIDINKIEFKHGYKIGLKEFCSKSSAIIHGLKGKKYKGICSKKKERRFLSSYNKGINKHLYARVKNLKKNIKLLKSKVKKLQVKLSQKRVK